MKLPLQTIGVLGSSFLGSLDGLFKTCFQYERRPKFNNCTVDICIKYNNRIMPITHYIAVPSIIKKRNSKKN